MSNFLAIATATATLGQILQAAVSVDVPGASVSTARPDGTGTTIPTTGVNLYLYQVAPNASWRNQDLPTRRSDGQLVQRPQAALDLSYLLTFYGSEVRLEPQRLLGSVVRTLHTRPILTREVIRETVTNSSFSYLADSNLADAIELVRFTPLPLSLEELSKLWSVFFQTPYALSLAYQGTVVLIESDDTPQTALPVRERMVYVTPFRQPVVDTITTSSGSTVILAESTIVITGTQLRGDSTRVMIGETEVTPDVANVKPARITMTLPAGLQAGVQSLQVIHLFSMGLPAELHDGVESNVTAFVLRPSVVQNADGTYQIAVTDVVAASDGTRSANISVTLNPAVGESQRLVLLLNQFASGGSPVAYRFSDPPWTVEDDETDSVTFPITGVQPGDYLVRVQVDGAESPLDTDSAADDPQYIAPTVTIP